MFNIDRRLFEIIFMQAHRNEFWDFLGIFFAEYLPYLLVIAFLVLVFYQRGWRQRLFLFCEGTLAIILSRGIVTSIFHFFYHEPRPFTYYGFTPLVSESGWSFPSGHMAWFFALAIIIWFMNRKWGWWFLGLSAVMGIARIYAGVHWPTDIIAGALLGLICGSFIHWLLAKSRKGIASPVL